MQTETVLEQLLTCSLPCTTDQLQAVLQQASNSYYNGGEMAIPDALFDQLKDTLQRLHPTAPCLTQIGAPVVGNRLPLPFGLYSLDKVKPGSKDLSKWQARFPGPYCISDKLDGTSCLIVYEKLGSRWRVKLFTRGKHILLVLPVLVSHCIARSHSLCISCCSCMQQIWPTSEGLGLSVAHRFISCELQSPGVSSIAVTALLFPGSKLSSLLLIQVLVSLHLNSNACHLPSVL